MPVSRQTWRAREHWAKRVNQNQEAGLKHGFRSGLEEINAKHLESLGVPVLFETRIVEYTVPETVRRYHVDFELPNGILIETKGKFEPVDRAKHLFIKSQHPELDVRFVFQKPKTPINKGSRTTYADWADKHGFKWATKLIPESWVREPSKRGDDPVPA